MDLDLDLEDLFPDLQPKPKALGDGAVTVTAAQGKMALPVQGQMVRELRAEDIVQLQNHVVARGAEPIKKLRDSHHWAARLLARGLSDEEVAIATGYSTSRISTLKCDPSFKQILAIYQKNTEEIAVDLASRYRALVADGTGELLERFDTRPEEFTSSAILNMVLQLGDRCGMAPTQNVNAKVVGLLSVDDESISKIKEAVNAASRGRVVTGAGNKTIEADSWTQGGVAEQALEEEKGKERGSETGLIHATPPPTGRV